MRFVNHENKKRIIKTDVEQFGSLRSNHKGEITEVILPGRKKKHDCAMPPHFDECTALCITK